MTLQSSELIGIADVKRIEELLKYWKGSYGVLSGIFTILPLGGLGLKVILPPGWLETALPVFGAILAVVLIGCFSFLFSHAAPRTFRRTAILLFVMSVIFLLAFVFLRAQYVVTVGDERHLLGPALTAEAQTAIYKAAVSNTPKDLLDYFGHESETRIWLYRPIVELVFVLAFCGFWACVAGGFFLFTLAIVLHKQKALSSSEHRVAN